MSDISPEEYLLREDYIEPDLELRLNVVDEIWRLQDELEFGEHIRQESKKEARKVEKFIVNFFYLWSGHWQIVEKSLFLRRLGRFLHSKRIYWLGLNVRWVEGLRDVLNSCYEYERIG